jgi:hypothetical protein
MGLEAQRTPELGQVFPHQLPLLIGVPLLDDLAGKDLLLAGESLQDVLFIILNPRLARFRGKLAAFRRVELA